MRDRDPPFELSREDLSDMFRRRRNTGACFSVIGLVSLFALVDVVAPAADRQAVPAAAQEDPGESETPIADVRRP